MEKQNHNGILNFLDLSINIHNNQHQFDIYRKPTQTEVVINNGSTHPWSHKYASFNCFIHRLFSLPLSVDSFNKEVNTIKQIAVFNNYSTRTIDRMINRKLNSIRLNQIYIQNSVSNNNMNILQKKYFCLSYVGNVSNRISNIFKSSEINIVFKTLNSLAKKIVNNKDSQNVLDLCGVYRLKCSDCNAVYVGRTFRSFKVRMKEHIRCQRTGSEDSLFANHLIARNHSFDPVSGFKALHLENKGSILVNLELLEIYKHTHNNFYNCVNAQTNTFTPTLFSTLGNLFNYSL